MSGQCSSQRTSAFRDFFFKRETFRDFSSVFLAGKRCGLAGPRKRPSAFVVASSSDDATGGRGDGPLASSSTEVTGGGTSMTRRRRVYLTVLSRPEKCDIPISKFFGNKCRGKKKNVTLEISWGTDGRSSAPSLSCSWPPIPIPKVRGRPPPPPSGPRNNSLTIRCELDTSRRTARLGYIELGGAPSATGRKVDLAFPTSPPVSSVHELAREPSATSAPRIVSRTRDNEGRTTIPRPCHAAPAPVFSKFPGERRYLGRLPSVDQTESSLDQTDFTVDHTDFSVDQFGGKA